MPIDPPEVHVVDDPFVVLLFVVLFAAAIVLALAFAAIGSRSVQAIFERDGDADPSAALWSTTPADDSAAWPEERRRTPPGD